MEIGSPERLGAQRCSKPASHPILCFRSLETYRHSGGSRHSGYIQRIQQVVSVVQALQRRNWQGVGTMSLNLPAVLMPTEFEAFAPAVRSYSRRRTWTSAIDSSALHTRLRNRLQECRGPPPRNRVPAEGVNPSSPPYSPGETPSTALSVCANPRRFRRPRPQHRNGPQSRRSAPTRLRS